MKPPIYRASWSRDGSIAKTQLGEPSERMEAAMLDASRAVRSGNRSVTILCDEQGADHSDNAGKFFLYRIIK